MKKKILSVLVVLVVVILGSYTVKVTETMGRTSKNLVVVIDPGHGGFDPGKVGVTGSLEKDINLSISYKIKQRLEKRGIQVIMTRTQDEAVCQESDTNKKSKDMQNRISVMNVSNAAIGVSIHQNSFTDSSSKGAQVFYYTGSKEGESLANTIQSNIKETLQDNNHRVAKANDQYYILRKAKCPVVIVECGFLSNYMEEALLMEEDYQDKMAEGISKGILSYLGE